MRYCDSVVNGSELHQLVVVFYPQQTYVRYQSKKCTVVVLQLQNLKVLLLYCTQCLHEVLAFYDRYTCGTGWWLV